MLQVLLVSLLSPSKNDVAITITIRLVINHYWILIKCDCNSHIILGGTQEGLLELPIYIQVNNTFSPHFHHNIYIGKIYNNTMG
jgi:hypothetical protein